MQNNVCDYFIWYIFKKYFKIGNHMKNQIDTRNLTKSETLINNYSQHISDYLESNDFMRINLRYILFISSVLT